MSMILIGGDHSTTTTLALAAGWPHDEPREAIVVEADPTGGSLAAWLDMPLGPSLSSLVTTLHQRSSSGAGGDVLASTVDSMTRRSTAGVRLIPAPFHAREAHGAIGEAQRTLFPLLGDSPGAVALVDVGRLDPLHLPAVACAAELCLVVHRQDASSAPAATVRLERLSETIGALRARGRRVGLVMIGDDPFSLAEVVDFTDPDGPAWALPVDSLAAAVLAGRAGVSGRRLARLPLMRATARVAAELARSVGSDRSTASDDRDPFARGGAA